MRKPLYFILLLVTLSVIAQAQRPSYYRRVFVDAEYFFLYEDYLDALPLYLELLNAYPDNTNVLYRIGLCYLNIPNEKHKSINFFEKAKKDVTESYKEGYFSETKAPIEVYLHYGRALRITADFDKALAAFKQYAKLIKDDKEKKLIVNREIESLAYAKNLMSNPMGVVFTSAGRTVNTRFPEVNPVVSADTTLMVYTSVQQFYSAIMLSNKSSKVWSNPLNLNSQLFADGQVSTVGISADGRTILLARNDNDVFNIYSTTFDAEKNEWSRISRLPKEINSRDWETYAAFNVTADTLYFSSNRPGGYGGFDLYFSVRVENEWSEAVNLGSVVNTPFDDIAPALSVKGNRLFYSSKGFKTMGGFDIFVSQRVKKTWTKPVNLQYPINTTDDDVFYQPIGNGSIGYVSRIMPQSFGENDIYRVEFNLDSLLQSTGISLVKEQSFFDEFPDAQSAFKPN